jgi:hypothetical protein
MNIDFLIESIKEGKIIEEAVLQTCCEKVKEILVEESNV